MVKLNLKQIITKLNNRFNTYPKKLIIFISVMTVLFLAVLIINNIHISEEDRHYPKYDKKIAEWQTIYDKYSNENGEESICYENNPEIRKIKLSNCLSIKAEKVDNPPSGILYSPEGRKYMKKGDFKIFYNAVYIDYYNYIKADKITMYKYTERIGYKEYSNTALFFEKAELISENGRWNLKKDKLYSINGTLFSNTESSFEDSKTGKVLVLRSFTRYFSNFNSEDFYKEKSSNEISNENRDDINKIKDIIEQYERKKPEIEKLKAKSNSEKQSLSDGSGSNSSNGSSLYEKPLSKEELEKLDAVENEQERLESDEYEYEDREEREYWEGEEYWKDEGVEVEVY